MIILVHDIGHSDKLSLILIPLFHLTLRQPNNYQNAFHQNHWLLFQCNLYTYSRAISTFSNYSYALGEIEVGSEHCIISIIHILCLSPLSSLKTQIEILSLTKNVIVNTLLILSGILL